MEIKNKYEYTYQKCSNENNCETLTDIILPDNRNQNELLIVDYEINIDENSLLARSTNNKDQNIINKFSKINYTINKNDKTTTIYGKTYSNLKNKVWDSSIINKIAHILEAKGRQEFYLAQKTEELNKLVELAKIQSTEASNAI